MDRIPLEVTDDESPIRFRDCFSVRYIQSAAVLCRLAYRIEKEHSGTGFPSDEIILRHEAFVLNSTLSSVAFLESTINELHADAADDAFFFADERQETLLRRISEGWKNEKNFDRAPLISKYQRILEIAGLPPFEEGDQAFDNVRQIVNIRNHLMHYRREWVVIQERKRSGGDTESASGRLGKVLKRKFAENPFASPHLPFFPERCLGHGCAEWAVVNSLIFTDAFFRKLDLPAPYEGIREDLLTR